MENKDILKIAVKTLYDKKASDIKIIRVEDVTVLAEYFVICTGTSSTQVKALSDEVEEKLSEAGVEPHHREGYIGANWVLLDFSGVIVHIFYGETREFYNLERLWADGTNIDVEQFLS